MGTTVSQNHESNKPCFSQLYSSDRLWNHGIYLTMKVKAKEDRTKITPKGRPLKGDMGKHDSL